jgi:hypothetical protein
MSLRRADPSSRGVLPSVIVKPTGGCCATGGGGIYIYRYTTHRAAVAAHRTVSPIGAPAGPPPPLQTPDAEQRSAMCHSLYLLLHHGAWREQVYSAVSAKVDVQVTRTLARGTVYVSTPLGVCVGSRRLVLLLLLLYRR